MADTKGWLCRWPPHGREAIGYEEDIGQTVDGRELRLRIDEDTDLNRLALLAHVIFGPNNVSPDNINIRSSEIGSLAGNFS